jgi:hypothetical protein
MFCKFQMWLAINSATAPNAIPIEATTLADTNRCSIGPSICPIIRLVTRGVSLRVSFSDCCSQIETRFATPEPTSRLTPSRNRYFRSRAQLLSAQNARLRGAGEVTLHIKQAAVPFFAARKLLVCFRLAASLCR